MLISNSVEPVKISLFQIIDQNCNKYIFNIYKDFHYT